MSERNVGMAAKERRFLRWRGADELLHAGPRQTIGKMNLVPRTRQSGIIK